MKNQKLWGIAAHATIVFSVVFLVLFVIDRINPAMEFLGSEQSDWMLLAFCCCTLFNGIACAMHLFRQAEDARNKPAQPPLFSKHK